MFEWIRKVWTGSEPVEFVSVFGLNESVQRLKAATRRWPFPFATQECATGTVKENRVSLQRVIPMFSNSFKPIFVGRFEQRHGKVVLIGRFTISMFVKVFMAFWFGMLALMALGSSVGAIAAPKAALFPLAAIGMMAMGIGIVALGQWFSRNDPAWLGDVIRTALQAQADAGLPHPSTKATVKATAGKTPAFILKATAMFALFGLMGMISAITGIQTYRGGAAGSIITHYDNETLRILVGVFAAAMLATACGIYRRMLFAWWWGFVLLAASAVYSMATLLSNDNMGNARIPALVFCGFYVVVAAIWGRWWYAQRVHFHS